MRQTISRRKTISMRQTILTNSLDKQFQGDQQFQWDKQLQWDKQFQGDKEYKETNNFKGTWVDTVLVSTLYWLTVWNLHWDWAEMIGTNTLCKLLARILKINFQQKYWAERARRNTKLCNASDVSWSVAVCKDCNTQGDNVQGVELSTIATAECRPFYYCY